MRRLMLLAVCLGGLIARSAAAQTDPTPDLIGIYLDQAGTVNCTESPAPYTLVPLYLVAANLSEPSGLAGWEAGIFTNPETLPVPLMLTAPLCDFGCELPFLHVGLAEALPRAPTMVLARLSLIYTGGPVKLLLGACEPTSFPDDPGPGYAAGDNPGRLVRLRAASTVIVDPQHPDRLLVCVLGAPDWCTPLPDWPAVETSTWGALKQLYD